MNCCFTGHRPNRLPLLFKENSDLYIKLYETLSDTIEQSISDGYTDFYTGMARGIDLLCGQIVLEKSRLVPDVHLHAVLPCPEQCKGWPKKDIALFDKILSSCSSRTVISPFYTETCMHSRNKFMVENSQRVIAVWNGSPSGGTAFTVRYAKSLQKEIFLIRPADFSVSLL